VSLRRELVLFAALAEVYVDALRRSLLPDTTLSPLQAKNRGLLPREGTVADVSYRFHGIGCAFVMSDERVVDVDFHQGVVPMFDVERAGHYVEAAPEDISEELQRLTAAGVLSCAQPGWYHLTD